MSEEKQVKVRRKSTSNNKEDKKGKSDKKKARKTDKDETKQLANRFVESTLAKGVVGLRADFNARRKGNDQNEMRAFIENAPARRNRYKDVGCLDNSRVVLKNYSTDYIHANYVSTPMNPKRFICTQGPVENTCADFWYMVVQENVESILMLCNIIEKGAKKCYEYFPASEGEELSFDKFVVKNKKMAMMNLKIDTSAKIRQSTLDIFLDGSLVKTTSHYHWVDWPDRGVPVADMAVITLLDRIRVKQTPIVVHCSAGIGRTGSVVLIEYALEAFGMGQVIESMDVILDKIRQQRSSSVQTDQQYLFVHQVLIEYFRARDMLDDKLNKKIETFSKEYQKTVIV